MERKRSVGKMRRSAHSWNGCEPPPETRRLSTPASFTTASRIATSSSRSVPWCRWIELFSSTMLSVISGFTAPGSLRLPSRSSRSAAPRERSRSCARRSCSSSSTPRLISAQDLKCISSTAPGSATLGPRVRLAGATQRELRRKRPEQLGKRDCGEQYSAQLAAEGGGELGRVAHHPDRETRHRKQGDRQQS